MFLYAIERAGHRRRVDAVRRGDACGKLHSGRRGESVLLRSIRSRLLALVVATVLPLTALIGAGLWSQLRIDQAAAVQQAINEARALAAQVDDHIGKLDNLLAGLSEAVSTNPRDTAANDALLQRVKSGQPEFVTRLTLSTLDGTNIGSSGGPEPRRNASGRSYFPQVLAGQRLVIGDVTRSGQTGQWIVNIARPVEDKEGRLRAVLAAGTWLEHLQDALQIGGLPAGSIVTIINQKGIVVARSQDGASWIGRDVNGWRNLPPQPVMGDGSQVTRWSADNVERITAFSREFMARLGQSMSGNRLPLYLPGWGRAWDGARCSSWAR
jgi:hypothetical protein